MFRSSRQSDSVSLPRAGRPLRATCARLAFDLAIILGGLASPFSSCPAFGQTVIDPRQEYNVKAVYLYSFGRYVVWPEGAMSDGEPFTIGILGGDPFAGALDQIAQKKSIGDRRIVIRHFESLADYQQCQILFLSKAASAKEQSEVIRELGGKSVLLVSDAQGFAARGGTVNFFVSDGTVRFEINVDAAKRQSLSIDAKLLSLAKLVIDT